MEKKYVLNFGEKNIFFYSSIEKNVSMFSPLLNKEDFQTKILILVAAEIYIKEIVCLPEKFLI